MLTYCFESAYVARTLAVCKRNDLAVVDTEGHERAVREAVSRGVYVYGYLNVGAVESGRSYYSKFKSIRIAPYDGWDGEYWIDPTAREWQEHILSLAKQIKATGAIGLYLDNTDIYYEIVEKQIHKQYSRNLPSAQAVYTALSNMILKINALGLIVMPNGGDTFVRKFIRAHPNIIKTVNQEGVLYQDGKKQSAEDTKYYTEYLDWCRKKGIYIRGIEYPKTKAQAVHAQLYYNKHRWRGCYISWHKDLRGD
jgi:uncharacterized protein (TIGR01370 family)